MGSLAATADDLLAFCDAADAAERLTLTRASVVLVRGGARASPRPGQTLIVVDDVRAAFIDIVLHLLPDSERPRDPSPGIDAAARVDARASVAPSACIGAGVVIGARSRVAAGAIIYADCEIGDDCVIGPNAVIGWVGLSYHDRKDGRRSFFPHLAGVRIGDRVDVGAQACICRGMLSHTLIGDDARIGSLVYVSHGVDIGARAWLSAGTAIAGHATIGAGRCSASAASSSTTYFSSPACAPAAVASSRGERPQASASRAFRRTRSPRCGASDPTPRD